MATVDTMHPSPVPTGSNVSDPLKAALMATAQANLVKKKQLQEEARRKAEEAKAKAKREAEEKADREFLARVKKVDKDGNVTWNFSAKLIHADNMPTSTLFLRQIEDSKGLHFRLRDYSRVRVRLGPASGNEYMKARVECPIGDNPIPEHRLLDEDHPELGEDMNASNQLDQFGHAWACADRVDSMMYYGVNTEMKRNQRENKKKGVQADAAVVVDVVQGPAKISLKDLVACRRSMVLKNGPVNEFANYTEEQKADWNREQAEFEHWINDLYGPAVIAALPKSPYLTCDWDRQWKLVSAIERAQYAPKDKAKLKEFEDRQKELGEAVARAKEAGDAKGLKEAEKALRDHADKAYREEFEALKTPLLLERFKNKIGVLSKSDGSFERNCFVIGCNTFDKWALKGPVDSNGAKQARSLLKIQKSVEEFPADEKGNVPWQRMAGEDDTPIKLPLLYYYDEEKKHPQVFQHPKDFDKPNAVCRGAIVMPTRVTHRFSFPTTKEKENFKVQFTEVYIQRLEHDIQVDNRHATSGGLGAAAAAAAGPSSATPAEEGAAVAAAPALSKEELAELQKTVDAMMAQAAAAAQPQQKTEEKVAEPEKESGRKRKAVSQDEGKDESDKADEQGPAKKPKGKIVVPPPPQDEEDEGAPEEPAAKMDTEEPQAPAASSTQEAVPPPPATSNKRKADDEAEASQVPAEESEDRPAKRSKKDKKEDKKEEKEGSKKKRSSHKGDGEE